MTEESGKAHAEGSEEGAASESGPTHGRWAKAGLAESKRGLPGIPGTGGNGIPGDRDNGGSTEGRVAAATEDRQAMLGFDEFLPNYEAPISPRDAFRRRLLAVVDMLSISLAYGFVWLIAPPDAAISEKLWLAIALPLWVLVNKLLGLYDRDANLIHKSTLDEIPRLVVSVTIGAALIFMFVPAFSSMEVGREQTIVFWLAALAMTPMMRGAARSLVSLRFEPERCLIVGSGEVSRMVGGKLAAHPEYGVQVLGRVDHQPADPATELGDEPYLDGPPLPLLGGMPDFDRICREFEVERIVFAFSSLSHEHLLQMVRIAKRLGVKISIVPRLYEVLGHAVEIDQIEGLTLFGLRAFDRPRSSLFLKRVLDVGGAGLGLVVLAPILPFIALAIKLTTKGPLFFSQERIGRGDKPFLMHKFRTMHEGADELKHELAHLNEADGIMFKIAEDPRVTGVGRFLRRTSLDELPQLWNVLSGEMSLVGPRPLIPEENAHLIGWHRTRLNLTPGVTGPWQVMGRTRIPFTEMVRLDYFYVAEWSLWNDIKLLIRTVPVVLRGRGA